ncbi:transcriptional repressor LexA [Intestinimonas massiliensis (ex Afouda et al. 2020)]|uniref:transcriptional repressor LexA n=1 Tax=Intestinimonas massiliensis (ex Afouda et al. 2020) TaxID=1673721 RepID=UPI001031779E|nr:transcriptional repressor LexA [Intestinimonas massiliensis (ex Afouda et al. 2020)]
MKALTPKQQQIYDYIVSFSEEHGYPPSVREIGEYVGLKSPSTVHFHLKGLENAGLITKAEGKTRAITVSAAHSAPVRPEPPRDRIPVVGNVAAGSPILAQECVEDYLTFETGGREGEYFALQVRGESMKYAGILPGDLVVVHQQSDAHNGEIVVALFEEEATVKTLRRKDGHTWLMPENPDYEPIDGDGCTILGKVTAVVRRY